MMRNAAELPDEANPGCSWCEKGSGLILLVGAMALAYIGIDLMSGGAVSRLLVGAVPADTDGELEGAAGLEDQAQAAAGNVTGA